MDTAASGPLWQAQTIPWDHSIPDKSNAAVMQPPQRQPRLLFGSSNQNGEFPLAANPQIVLHVLTECHLDPQDLARLEASAVHCCPVLCSGHRRVGNVGCGGRAISADKKVVQDREEKHRLAAWLI